MAEKTILDTLKANIAALGTAGGFVVLTQDQAGELLKLIDNQRAEFVRMENAWRREVERVRSISDDYTEPDDDYGEPEDRDCAYWERVMRDDL